MSVGIVGPIGEERLAAFALSRTFRLTNQPRFNLQTATCKICGAPLPKGEGQEILIQGQRVGQLDAVFLCPLCYHWIEVAHQQIQEKAHAFEEG